MLLINGFEVSKRTSTQYPYAHKDGDTIFLPINIVETQISTGEEEISGYKFDEYRFNKGADLPKEVVETMIDAFVQDEEALSVLGLKE